MSNITTNDQSRASVLCRCKMRSLVSAEPIVKHGLPPGVILKIINDRKVDLAILGAKNHRGGERLVFGSTAEGVLREALCPVLTPRQATAEITPARDRLCSLLISTVRTPAHFDMH